MKRILFVCTGNTCRSPMAEAIFNKLAPSEFIAYSAGISCSEGKPVSENSILALSELCITTNHTSVMINQSMIREYDVVFGITDNHARMLRSLFPEYAEKIYSFPCDVGDPYGQDLGCYRKCRDLIYKSITTIITQLKNE